MKLRYTLYPRRSFLFSLLCCGEKIQAPKEKKANKTKRIASDTLLSQLLLRPPAKSEIFKTFALFTHSFPTQLSIFCLNDPPRISVFSPFMVRSPLSHQAFFHSFPGSPVLSFFFSRKKKSLACLGVFCFELVLPNGTQCCKYSLSQSLVQGKFCFSSWTVHFCSAI